MAPDRPRVTIVTNGNVFSNIALTRLFDDLATRVDFQVITTTGLRRTHGNRLVETQGLVRRWGWRYSCYKLATYAIPFLQQLFTGEPRFVVRTCRRRGIPILNARSVNTATTRARIKAFGPDLLVSYSCPYRIQPKTLALPRIGCINVHSSLLPAYAGVCTYVHVLAEGAAVTGVTVHEMVEVFDAGQIVDQQEVKIRPGISVCALFAEQCRVAGGLLSAAVDRCLATGAIVGREQDPTARSYRGEPGSEDIKRMIRRGHPLMRREDLRLFSARRT